MNIYPTIYWKNNDGILGQTKGPLRMEVKVPYATHDDYDKKKQGYMYSMYLYSACYHHQELPYLQKPLPGPGRWEGGRGKRTSCWSFDCCLWVESWWKWETRQTRRKGVRAESLADMEKGGEWRNEWFMGRSKDARRVMTEGGGVLKEFSCCCLIIIFNCPLNTMDRGARFSYGTSINHPYLSGRKCWLVE